MIDILMLAGLVAAFAAAALYVVACADLVGERRPGSDSRP